VSKEALNAEPEREMVAHEAVVNELASGSEMAASVDEKGRAVNEVAHVAGGKEAQVAREGAAPADANVEEPYLLARLVAHRTVGT
jgi:hypothetical protein